jgi:hypothetical protein
MHLIGTAHAPHALVDVLFHAVLNLCVLYMHPVAPFENIEIHAVKGS